MTDAGVSPRHDPTHHERILCGRPDCSWPIAGVRHHDDPDGPWPPESIFPTVPVDAYVVAHGADGRPAHDAIYEPTNRTLGRTARARHFLAAGTWTYEQAIRLGRPGARSNKRRTAAAEFEILRTPCGLRCPACCNVNRFSVWSLQSGLA
jgi:hypothetical protein